MIGNWHDVTSSDGGAMSAYIAMPERPNGAALVVLQEIFGVNPNICNVTDGFAAAGFVAIAPDLFWRQSARVSLDPSKEEDRATAMKLMGGMDVGLAVQDSLSAAEFARDLTEDGGKVGCVGFCLGGKLAFLLACEPQIAAAISYYGVQIEQCLDRTGAITAPVLLHIAQDDHLCPPASQANIVATLQAGPALASVMLHPGVGHGFARQGGAAFDAAASERADAATLALLRRSLLA